MVITRRCPYKNRLHVLTPGGYISRAAAKAVAGIGTPSIIHAPNRASGFFVGTVLPFFFCIMVGRVGASKDAPGSRMTGSSNPARLTTLEIGTSGGELSKSSIHEVATLWQTVIIAAPARTAFISIPKSIAACTALILWRCTCRRTYCACRSARYRCGSHQPLITSPGISATYNDCSKKPTSPDNTGNRSPLLYAAGGLRTSESWGISYD